MEKICKVCGKKFHTDRESSVYCSRSCLWESQRRYKTCPICGKTFNATRKATIYCSPTCRGEAQKNYRVCPVCGKKFHCAPSVGNVCCSTDCSAAHRKDIYATRGSYNLNRGKNWLKIRDEFAAEHQGEQHQSAKTYIIQGPDGRTHDVTNLSNWVRECGYFESPQSALRALHRTNPDGKGKIKRSDYRGWSIVAVIGQNSPGKQREIRYCKVCGKELPSNRRSYCGPECRKASRRKEFSAKTE